VFLPRGFFIKELAADPRLPSTGALIRVLTTNRTVVCRKVYTIVPSNGGLKQGWEGKFSHFLALSINISKTVADRAKVTINY